MKNCKTIISSLLTGFVVMSASADISNVIPIPWEGDVTKFHTAVTGQAITVKGLIKTTDTSSFQYQWNFGDGSPFTALTSLSGQTRYLVSTTHAYTGSVGTPFVAWLIATNPTTTTAISNQYLVQIQAAGLDANINIAIDNGLWFEYQRGNYVPAGSTATSFNTFDQTACVWWQSSGSFNGSGFYSAPTASAVQAFEINGSLATGNFNQDPYAEYVAGGLNFLFKGYSYGSSIPVLQAVNIAPRSIDPWDNPDSNGDGIGIQTYDDEGSRDPYQGGMVIDAIVASGTPNTLTGRQFISGVNFTYQQVVQDMCDMYAWGQDIADIEWTTFPSTLTSLPVGTPDSITFNMFDLNCGGEGTYTFYVNGQSVGTSAVPPYCNCNGNGHANVTVAGSALASAWSLNSPPNMAVSYTGGGSYGPSWIHATLSFSGSDLTLCLTNFNSQGCDNTYACDGYNNSAFTASNLVSSFPVLTDNKVAGIIGGWHYTWQYGDQGDNSASQWAAIGQIAAQQPPFNAVVPQWVKDYDNNYLNYSYTTDNGGLWGHFGYNSPGQFTESDGYYGEATTPSGMVQLVLDGYTTSDPRWQAAEAWLAQNWDATTYPSSENWLYNVTNQTIYGAYAVTKAMRLAQPSAVVTFATNNFDWYHGNVADPNGLAKIVSDNLVAHGAWWVYNGEGSGNDYWAGQTLATAWAVIILKPNLFSAGPTACFSANPNPGFAAPSTISFDPTCSTDPQPGGIANLVTFDWNWGDGTPDTITSTPEVVTHAFTCASLPCSYVVTLTVYDNSSPQLNSSAQQTINITQPPHPPVAVPGGPYIVSLCSCDGLTLDGAGSFTPDQGLSQNNCNSCPPDGLTSYGWALQGAPYVYGDSTNTNVVLNSTGIATYFPASGTYQIGLQVVDDAASSFPTGTPNNLTNDAFTSVTVYNCGPTVTATPGCGSVALSWNDVGASSYIILTSTTGPNSGFTTATTTGTGVTTASVPATLNQTEWIRVQAVNANGAISAMSCAVQVTDTLDNCVCIDELTIYSKATLIELDWPLVQGASSYNVYRSTAPGVLETPGNRIATGVGTVHGVYTDGGLINGRTYYYKVTAVTGGVETCTSVEVHGTPATVP